MWRSLVVALALLASVGWGGLVRAGDGEVGWVKTLAGDASIERAGERRPAVLGEPLFQGDKIVTGADGSIGMTFTDNTAMSTGPNSAIVIETYDYDPAKFEGAMLADLLQGTLAVQTGDLPRTSPEAVRVRTPSAILGVRGTKFVVRAAAAKS